MIYVYRYTDLADGIIKYVGIVYGEKRCLDDRVKEHEYNDEWCRVRKWKIEYLNTNIKSRTDAEFLESHFISLYGTGDYFNKAKVNYGVSNLVSYSEEDWVEYHRIITPKTAIRDSIENLKKQEQRYKDELAELKNKCETIKIALSENEVVDLQDLLSKIDEKINQYRRWYNDTCQSGRQKWADRAFALSQGRELIIEALLGLDVEVVS